MSETYETPLELLQQVREFFGSRESAWGKGYFQDRVYEPGDDMPKDSFCMMGCLNNFFFGETEPYIGTVVTAEAEPIYYGALTQIVQSIADSGNRYALDLLEDYEGDEFRDETTYDRFSDAVINWNDDEERRRRDVLFALDRAIEREKSATS